MNNDIEQIPDEFDPILAIAIGQHMADLQFDVAESSYSKRLDQNYKGFCLTQASDEAMSRYLGEHIAIVRLDERLRLSRSHFVLWTAGCDYPGRMCDRSWDERLLGFTTHSRAYGWHVAGRRKSLISR